VSAGVGRQTHLCFIDERMVLITLKGKTAEEYLKTGGKDLVGNIKSFMQVLKSAEEQEMKVENTNTRL